VRREGTNPNDVQMSDVLCDFCRAEWTLERLFIEGHHGSCICGDCLSAAYRHVSIDGKSDAQPGYKCTMCLEERLDPAYRSPTHPEAFVCRRCVKLAATALEKDPESGWERPGGRRQREAPDET
jgi:hypothetical protein